MTKFLGVAVGMAVLAGVLLEQAAGAQAPAGATGQCKDGTYSSAAKKWQACAGHKGVQTWFAEAKTVITPVTASTSTPSTAPAPRAANSAISSPNSAAATAKTAAITPGGGSNLVWVNTATNVYHCPGGTFYGKTKEGKYMSEADAKKAGAHGDRGKVCSK